MELDPKALKEINTVVDGFIKKNRDSVQNAKVIDKLQKRFSELEKKLAQFEKWSSMVDKHLDEKILKNDKLLLKRIEEIEKLVK